MYQLLMRFAISRLAVRVRPSAPLIPESYDAAPSSNAEGVVRRTTIGLIVAMLLAPMGAGVSCGRDEAAAAPRVLVFGIDGGTWDVMDELLARGELPHIETLRARGVHGILESRPPLVSPVVWSTMFTGQPHDEHGVQHWRTSQAVHRKVEAVWNIASAAGLQTHVFNVPSTWPAEPIAGTMVSGFPLSGSTIGHNTGQVVSAAMELQLDRPTATSVRGEKTVEQLRNRFGERLADCYQRNSEAIRSEMAQLAIGAWSAYFEIPVSGQPTWSARLRIKRLARDSYYLSPCYRADAGLVISDPAEARSMIEAELGELYIPEGPGWSKYAEEATPSYLYEHLVQVARNQTRAAVLFADTRWQLFIYVDTLVDRVSHVYWAYMQAAEYDGLDAVKVARYGNRVRDAYRETDRHLGEILAAADGETYVIIVSDHGFESNPNRTDHVGNHHVDGMYLVAGPGLKREHGQRAYIEDVGPTVLHLLGLPLGRDMKGGVIPSVSAQLDRPITFVDSHEDGTRVGTDVPIDAATWEQLRGLGYVDDSPPPDQQKQEMSTR